MCIENFSTSKSWSGQAAGVCFPAYLNSWSGSAAGMCFLAFDVLERPSRFFFLLDTVYPFLLVLFGSSKYGSKSPDGESQAGQEPKPHTVSERAAAEPMNFVAM